MKTQLSKPTVLTFAALAAMGFVYGITLYVERPATYSPNDPANNAIVLHALLAVLAAITVFTIQIRRSGKRMPSIWLAPFSVHAFTRLRQTFALRPFSFVRFVRAIACLPLLYILLWEPFRAAMQLVAARDPSFIANAWGGPSYWGASLAHWLDGAIIFYVSAWLLHVVMVRKR